MTLAPDSCKSLAFPAIEVAEKGSTMITRSSEGLACLVWVITEAIRLSVIKYTAIHNRFFALASSYKSLLVRLPFGEKSGSTIADEL